MAQMATVLLQKPVAHCAALIPELRNFLFSEQKAKQFPSCSATHQQPIRIHFDSEYPDDSVLCASNIFVYPSNFAYDTFLAYS
jgi:hypothetical protein